MNTKALNDIKTLLQEVGAGTWRPSLGKPGVKEWLDNNGESRGLHMAHWGEQQVDCMGEACGFTACAIGHAALDDRFPWIHSNPHADQFGMELEFTQSGDPYAIWESLSDHLDVEKEVAFYMFSDERYLAAQPTAEMVIERIDQVLNGEKQ